MRLAPEAELSEYDEPYETDEPEVVEDDPDPLADLDPAARARLDQRVEQARRETFQQTRAGLQRAGLDLTEDGQPALRDPATARRWMGVGEETGVGGGQQATDEGGGTAASRTPAPDSDEDEIPDPLTQPREFRKWLKNSQQSELAAVVAQALQPVAQALQQVNRRTINSEIGRALERVPEAIRRYAPMIEGVLDHPQFEVAMRQVLQQVEPEMWEDPLNLARMAGGLLADLAISEPARPTRVRAETAPASRRATSIVARAALDQAAPSRDAGRARGGGGPVPTNLHAVVAARQSALLGRTVTPEEIAAYAQDDTGDAAADFRAKARAAQNSRGRG